MGDLIDREALKAKIYKDFDRCHNTLEFLSCILIRIEDAHTVNRWIPCSERLPKIDKDVIVFYPHWRDNPIQIAHLNYDKMTFELSDGEFNFPASKVTHWMSLPEPPKSPL